MYSTNLMLFKRPTILSTKIYSKRRYMFLRVNFMLLIVAGLLFLAKNTNAQELTNYQPFDGSVHVKNMHTWHGFVVEPGAIVATSLEYATKNKKFVLGLWGGASFNGKYKEFSYYASYHLNKHLKFELVSHNNYSGLENYDIFSYDKETSPNFLDIAVYYTVSDKIPLTVYWGTILAGQGGDYTVDKKGEITDSYSNYVEMKYKVWNKDGYYLSLFAGAAFSFTTDETYYSEEANLVNVGLTLNKTAKVLSRNIPLEFTGFWNPEKKLGVLQVDITLF